MTTVHDNCPEACMPHRLSRRRFLHQTTVAACALPALPSALANASAPTADPPKIYVFSKHLQFLNHADLADAAAQIGFDGVDLTVRPQGHVLPERIETDLPPAVDALKRVGFTAPLMTTAIDDAADATSQRVLQTAAGLGIRYYRTNWFRYDANRTMPDEIQRFGRRLRALGELNQTLNLTGCYQNHAGQLVGASAWELWEMLNTTDPRGIGVQYDIRHATVEGGLSWPNGLRLLHPRIQTLVIKDFQWTRRPAGTGPGGWAVQDVPFGEGQVDFATYFRLLKQYQIRVPISLHFEYPLGGAEHGATRLSVHRDVVFAAMRRDLARLKTAWQAT